MNTRQHVSNETIAASLVLAITLWGANNTGIRYLVGYWPPVFVGSLRFLSAGLLLLGLMRVTGWPGAVPSLSPDQSRILWRRTGLSLALYIVTFNWSLRLTTASNVALYFGVSPLIALLVDTRPRSDWPTVRPYLGAALAFVGVAVLFWPSLSLDPERWLGELLACGSSVIWAYHGLQCRALTNTMSGAAITAHTMWRAGLILVPVALMEISSKSLPLRLDLCLVQLYCSLGGGVAAFTLWNTALRHWPASRVFLFINLSPLSTMAWAHFCLGERVSATYLPAMILILGGVMLAQIDTRKAPMPPEE